MTKFREILNNALNNFLRTAKTRLFLISFGASIAVVLVVFLIAFLATRNVDEPQTEETFVELPVIDNREPVESPDDEEEEEEEEEELPADHMFSILTGEFMHEDLATRRPLAVVTNNIHRALPQSGIASADIIYEVLAEGDITRLVAIYQSHVPEKIGSVRSTRDYFIDFAYNHDAIFIFHGGSPTGYGRVRSTGIDNMDGGRLEGRVFWRDRTYPAWARYSDSRPMEHSSYTGVERIDAYLEESEVRSVIGNDSGYGFLFGEMPEIEAIGEAEHVVVPFSQNYTRTFIYCDENDFYLVENRDGAHRDAETEEQVVVSNVLIQFASMNAIAGDEYGRMNVRTVGEGSGFLIRNGTYYPVLWEKESHTSPMRWFFEDGTPIVLMPGSTWICVFQSSGTVRFEAP